MQWRKASEIKPNDDGYYCMKYKGRQCMGWYDKDSFEFTLYTPDRWRTSEYEDIEFLDESPTELPIGWKGQCGSCGGNTVEIRGRYPGHEKRIVCPTCLKERMESISDIASEHYGQAAKVNQSIKGE